MAGIEVILNDLSKNPACPHGPTVLFSRYIDGEKRNFYACSACRDRKLCTFFIWENELNKQQKHKKEAWEKERKKFIKNINHRKLFLALNEIEGLSNDKRMFCHTCSRFEFEKYKEKHLEHNVLNGISDYDLQHPSEVLPPLEDAKKEAQFLFSKKSVQTLVEILKDLNYRNVVCIGTPRIHEYINAECPDMNTILLDIDERFHHFYGPLKFCWYNSFNNHFFFEDAKSVFEEFLQNNGGKDLVLITDPPFGGRVELLSNTLKSINIQYRNLNKLKNNLPIFWAFPYFMEPQIMNSLPEFKMLDYKIDYDNHPLFQDGPKGRKQGSPVRLFTNLDPSLIRLPKEEGYRFCKLCKRWVSEENKHCAKCNSCTSKDGRTYVHCDLCERCIKPTWQHCEKCSRCAQNNHKCGEIAFIKECFHCKKPGHKKIDCPEIDRTELFKKRKNGLKFKNKKKRVKKC